MKGKKRTQTKRARILMDVLECINRGDYDYFNEYLICGGSFDELIDEATDLSKKPDTAALRRAGQVLNGIKEAVSDLPIKRGQRALQRKASLQRPSQRLVIKGLDRLAQANAGGVADAIRNALDAPRAPEAASEKADRELDELDAALSAEVLGRLPKMVDRAARLSEVRLEGTPEDVEAYFYEAHRCYLYGFRIACAVLCRAIIEGALKQVVDADGRVEREVQSRQKKPAGEAEDRKHSYYKALVEAAKLSDDRPRCAIEVRDAGNDAIHNLAVFNNRWGGKLDEILINTRKVLEDLYARPESR